MHPTCSFSETMQLHSVYIINNGIQNTARQFIFYFINMEGVIISYFPYKFILQDLSKPINIVLYVSSFKTKQRALQKTYIFHSSIALIVISMTSSTHFRSTLLRFEVTNASDLEHFLNYGHDDAFFTSFVCKLALFRHQK